MNILVLSSVYPSPEDHNENVTKVVRYFVKSWSEQGHTVRVIHNVHRYPFFLHGMPSGIKKKLATKINFYIPDLSDVKERQFDDGDVKVWRLPIKKIIPHGEPGESAIKKQVEKISSILEREGFLPDVCLGHWASPQMAIMAELKKRYNFRTALVLHGKGYIENPKTREKYMPYIDRLGCRSDAEAKYLKDTLGLDIEPFVCYSGVPDRFIEEFSYDSEKFSEKPRCWRLVFAGRLLECKHLDKLIKALSKLQGRDFVLDIIGTGPEEAPLKALAEELGIKDRVVFHGRLPREEVLSFMRKAHSFVMVSKGEVFGLVYLEAMAASCVTIGSRDEGIDGVIRHGENGLLSAAADADELQKVLERMFDAPLEELKELSRKGYETAKEFTDSQVARWYLEDVCGHRE